MDPFTYYSLAGFMPCVNYAQTTAMSNSSISFFDSFLSANAGQPETFEANVRPWSDHGQFHFHPPTTAVETAAPLDRQASDLKMEAATFGNQVVHLPQVPENDGSDIVPNIVNVVCSVDMCCKLDLNKISSMARNSEYKPKRFNGLTMRIKEPKATANIFDSGRMICMGTKSVESAKLASRKFARILQKLGYKVKFESFKIINMVGSCSVKFNIRQELLWFSHSQFCEFEPEIFPGLVYKMVKPKITILVFASGNLVLTGAKNENDIREAFEKIYGVLKKFRDDRSSSMTKHMSK